MIKVKAIINFSYLIEDCIYMAENIGNYHYYVHINNMSYTFPKGYFITIEEEGKKKVSGFIIYNIEIEIKKSYLLFILIDKKYQKNGLGTELINKYIKDVEEKMILYASVKIENREVSNFYKKFGFDNHSNLIEYIKGKYEMLHYIPKKSLKVLLVLKCLSNKK